MAKDKSAADAAATDIPATVAADTSTPPEPKVISGTAQDIDNHALPRATPDYAGQYTITHGSVRIGDKFYGKGTVLQLGADDGKNFTEAGIAERLEG